MHAKTLLYIGALGLAAAAVHAEEPDTRQLLTVTEAQRALVLNEMRALLAATQRILGALAAEDMSAAAEAARSVGMAMAHKSEDALKGAPPESFMHLGMAVHQDFDRIGADAQAVKDPTHTLRQLSDSMGKCVACHASYRLQDTGPSTDTRTAR